MKPLALIVVVLAVLVMELPLTNTQNSKENITSYPFEIGGNASSPIKIMLGMVILGLFSIACVALYLRVCFRNLIILDESTSLTFPIQVRQRINRGLDRSVVDSFPVYLYSEVKDRMIQERNLECAICLSEFADDERLRYIPNCHHVFHPECIDAWFASHTTCPVCRADLSADNDGAPEFNHEMTRVQIDEPRTEIETQNYDSIDIEEEPNPRLLRSHTTGHSLVEPGEDCAKYTLRLREEAQEEGTVSLRRSKSCGCDIDGNSRGRGADDGAGGQLWSPDGLICGRSELKLVGMTTFDVETYQGESSSSSSAAADLPV